MYTKILVPLDGSQLAEQALPYAALLAEGFRIPVELLRVNDPTLSASSPPLGSVDYLKGVSQRHFPSSQASHCAVEAGNPAEVIVDRGAANRGAVIVMATHGVSGMRRWFLGSVTNKVIRTAMNPMLIVRPAETAQPRAPIQLKTLIVPLDGSGLAEKVLPQVIALTKTLGLEVNLVRAYKAPAESYGVVDGLYMDIFNRERENIRKGLDDYLGGNLEVLQAAGLKGVVSIAVEGDAAGEIIDMARRTPNSLIAMSTHGRSGVGRWVLGSVAEKVIQHSGDPVLLIRPDQDI